MDKYILENKFDAVDIRILSELSSNARIAFSLLAKKLNVSNSLIHQRVKRLEEMQVLKQAVYLLDAEMIGYETVAFTQIMISHARYLPDIIKSLEEINEIVECVNIAGRYALMVKIYAINNRHLRNVIYEKIQTIDGIEGTNTLMSFETAFRRTVSLDF